MQSSSGSTPTTEEASTRHIPVLLQEVLEVLNIQKNDTVLDGTLGGGGHALALAEYLGKNGHFIGLDVDEQALKRAESKLSSILSKKILVKANFRDIQSILSKNGIRNIDKALFDLGWSSDQLEISGRGFTFQKDEPLSMTLSSDHSEDTLTAFEIVNTWDEENLADIIYGWGGERFSRRIARAIVAARKEKEIVTTFQLVDIVTKAVPRRGKSNPATKTFQALRIAVNDELGALSSLLEQLPHSMAPGSIVVFLTFHSLEDKQVKNTFRTWKQDARGEILTKKPLTANASELSSNSRSRSAKLRAFKFI